MRCGQSGIGAAREAREVLVWSERYWCGERGMRGIGAVKAVSVGWVVGLPS